MKKKITFRVFDLAVAGVGFSCCVAYLIMGFDRPVNDLFLDLHAFFRSISPELFRFFLGLCGAVFAGHFILVDLLELARLFWNARAYKRMGFDLSFGSSPCDDCSCAKVCDSCRFNPCNSGGWLRG